MNISIIDSNWTLEGDRDPNLQPQQPPGFDPVSEETWQVIFTKLFSNFKAEGD